MIPPIIGFEIPGQEVFASLPQLEDDLPILSDSYQVIFTSKLSYGCWHKRLLFLLHFLPDRVKSAFVRNRIMMFVCLDSVPENQSSVGGGETLFDQL